MKALLDQIEDELSRSVTPGTSEARERKAVIRAIVRTLRIEVYALVLLQRGTLKENVFKDATLYADMAEKANPI